MDKRAEFIPFIFLSDNQITNMNTVDSMKLYDMLPEDNVFSEALKTNSLKTNCLNINDDDTKDDDK